MLIKFTGDFKKLIPMGFTFHKLFASNYKVYEKEKVWIWVAHGGYVEIDDLFGLSGYVLKAIFEENFPVYEADVIYKGELMWLAPRKGDRKPCMINRDTGEIIEKRKFNRIYVNEECEYDYDLFREVSIYKETFNFLKQLKNMNMFEIVEHK